MLIRKGQARIFVFTHSCGSIAPQQNPRVSFLHLALSRTGARVNPEIRKTVLGSMGSESIDQPEPGQEPHLVPGMQVNAEIQLGTRSDLEYLLSPVQKVAHETGRQR